MENKKMLKILTTFKDDGTVYHEDSQLPVDKPQAEYFCRCGWAEDLTGEFPTGNPSPTEVILKPEPVKTEIK